MRVCEHTPFRIGWNQDVARLRMWSCRLAKHTPGDVPRKPEHPIKEIKQTNKKMQAEESSHSGFLTWARGRVVLVFFLHPPVNKSKDRESTAHLPMYPLSATPRTVPSNPWILFFFFPDMWAFRLKVSIWNLPSSSHCTHFLWMSWSSQEPAAPYCIKSSVPFL